MSITELGRIAANRVKQALGAPGGAMGPGMGGAAGGGAPMASPVPGGGGVAGGPPPPAPAPPAPAPAPPMAPPGPGAGPMGGPGMAPPMAGPKPTPAPVAAPPAQPAGPMMGGPKMAQVRAHMLSKMAKFVYALANKVPAGTKAAQIVSNQRRANVLLKLADHIVQTGNVVTAVQRTYPTKSAAYQHRVVTGLISGLAKTLHPTEKQAMASLGVSKHPSASPAASPKPGLSNGVQTTGPISTGVPVN